MSVSAAGTFSALVRRDESVMGISHNERPVAAERLHALGPQPVPALAPIILREDRYPVLQVTGPEWRAGRRR